MCAPWCSITVPYWRRLRHWARLSISAQGEVYTLVAILAIAREISGHNFTKRVNSAFVRQNEVKKLIGSCARLQATVGALPVIPLRDTLRDAGRTSLTAVLPVGALSHH